MSARTLPKEEWKTYFDRMSKGLPVKLAEIEVAGLELGDQVEAEWVVLNGISYDPKDDVVILFTDRIDHMIRRPREIYVDDGIDGLHSVEVIDADGNRQIAVFREALKLPAPTNA